MSLDSRARSIFQYFKNYNYEVAGTGEVIRFVGNYRASKGQAAALVFYTFLGALTCGNPSGQCLDAAAWHAAVVCLGAECDAVRGVTCTHSRWLPADMLADTPVCTATHPS